MVGRSLIGLPSTTDCHPANPNVLRAAFAVDDHVRSSQPSPLSARTALSVERKLLDAASSER